MRAGVDLRSLQTASGRRGVGGYARRLVREMRRRRRSGEEIVGFVSAARDRSAVEPDAVDRLVDVPGPASAVTLLDPLRMGRLLRREKIDLFHALLYAPPFRTPEGTKVVQTVHDLTPLLFPDGYTAGERLLSRTAFLLAARVDRVVAVSENTRRDLERLAAVPPSRVEVIPPGIDDLFNEDLPREEALAVVTGRHGIRPPYVLQVGGHDPLKNGIVALAAVARLRREGLAHGLVVAGEPGRYAEEFRREADGFELGGAVAQTGWVEPQDLVPLYRAAEVVIHPSLYGGFGLPPLEAMACGTPVVASTAASLPEVLGDACPLVEPHDHAGFAREMRRLLEDPGARADAIRRGRETSGRYRWDAAAESTLALYRRLAAGVDP